MCAFCATNIPEGGKVLGFGAKTRPDVDLERHRGSIIEITLVTLKRKVPVVVTGLDSPAAREGHDLYFVVCSEPCAKALKETLAEKIKGGSLLLN